MADALTRSLVLIGFMGAGKSTAARNLGALLGVPVADADALIEERLGQPIATIFERDGEAAFRAVEEAVCRELLDPARAPGVVALGGGALGAEPVREALRAHVAVHLDVPLATSWERVAGSSRPLARDRQAFEALFGAREAGYRAAADATLPSGDPALLERVLPSLRSLDEASGEHARLLWATSASADYPVWVGPDATTRAPWPLGEASRPIVISDSNVADLYAGRVSGIAGLVEFQAGEEHKTLATCERVWRSLVAQGVTRADHLVAVGGGVVGDLAGFVAATFQRGIPVVQVPTTLVAQVDSAFGGKTGVDLPEAKNYIGCYHQPAAVFVDPSVLSTLPAREFAAGYAEVVKTALIAGGTLWDRVGAGVPVDDDIIFDCARAKLAIVAADERDGGRRQVLNLGHTIGHAIETVTGYARLRHGEAVGLGLLAALRLSGQDELRDHVGELLDRAGLPSSVSGVDADAVVAATHNDKKRVGEHVPFVLCNAPGDVRFGAQVTEGDVRAAVAELLA